MRPRPKFCENMTLDQDFMSVTRFESYRAHPLARWTDGRIRLDRLHVSLKWFGSEKRFHITSTQFLKDLAFRVLRRQKLFLPIIFYLKVLVVVTAAFSLYIGILYGQRPHATK